MNPDTAIEIIKNMRPFNRYCGLRLCKGPAVRQLIWPSGGSVYLCENHKDDLLVTDSMQVVDFATATARS